MIGPSDGSFTALTTVSDRYLDYGGVDKVVPPGP
jgi:hypothetical protein